MASKTDGKQFERSEGHGKERRLHYRRAHDERNAAVGALGAWLIDQQLHPLFLVDPKMTLHFHNRAARELVEQNEWLAADRPRTHH
jgi:hypothetical protein